MMGLKVLPDVKLMSKLRYQLQWAPDSKLSSLDSKDFVNEGV